MNSFSKFLAATTLVAGALTLSPAAFADTLTFGSYVGSTMPMGFSNTPIVYGATQATGTAVVAAPYSYSTVLPGTAFVSSTSSTGAAVGTMNYFTTVNGAVAGETGSISVAADDTVNVLLNGVSIGNTAMPLTIYDTVVTYDFTFGAMNTFEFIVNNAPGGTFNPTGLDFLGSAATPEPSSLVLLGSGLVSAAGMLVRRRRVS